MFNAFKSQVVYPLLAVLLILLVSCSAPQPTAATIQPSNTPIQPTNTLVPPTSTPIGPPPTPPPTARPTFEPSDTGHIEKGQITSQALANNLVGDPATRDFIIYLPPNYDFSKKRYPVVYALHGFLGNEWELTPMTSDLDLMLDDGAAEEMIIVFVDGSNQFGGSWYLSSPTIGDYESYIVQELVDHIDANYRTLPSSDSRGITGCSMGGTGALSLALKYPDVFGVAAPMSGMYSGDNSLWWEHPGFRMPEELGDLRLVGANAQSLIAAAAAAAPNPDRPPFYLDMPFTEIDGESQIVQEVYEKVNAAFPVNNIRQYLDQPLRLRGLLIYHGEFDDSEPIEPVRDFDRMLEDLGIEHEYLEVKKAHCNLDYTPVLSFMSDYLAFEK